MHKFAQGTMILNLPAALDKTEKKIFVVCDLVVR